MHSRTSPQWQRATLSAEEIISVLRADDSPESRTAVASLDSLIPAELNILGLEGLAKAAGLTPQRLWGLFCSASLMQGVVVVLASEFLAGMEDRPAGGHLSYPPSRRLHRHRHPRQH
jgi:hypothetical protein